MKILSLKYKMHRLVNLVFYLAIFIFGFLLGFATDKININDFISNFLFIDNVNAYSINNEFDEEYIFTNFSRDETFDINEYPYIYVIEGQAYFNSQYHNIFKFHAFPKDFFKKTELIDNNTYQVKDGELTYFEFSYNKNFSVGDVKKTTITSFTFLSKPSSTWFDSSLHFYSNFDFEFLSEEENLKYNVLDFSNYITSSGDEGNEDNKENENTGGDSTDEDIEVEVVNSSFYEFARNLFGEVNEENLFIYDFITLGLVSGCFILFILIVGYIVKKIFGG